MSNAQCVCWAGRLVGLGRRWTRPVWDETMISRSICKTVAAAFADAEPPPRSRVPVGRFQHGSSLCARTRRRDCSAYFIIIILYYIRLCRSRACCIWVKRFSSFLNEPAGYQYATGCRVVDPVPMDRFGTTSWVRVVVFAGGGGVREHKRTTELRSRLRRATLNNARARAHASIPLIRRRPRCIFLVSACVLYSIIICI